MSVTSTAPTYCQKCALPTGSVTYYIGGIRLCGLCYSAHLSHARLENLDTRPPRSTPAGGSAASPAPGGGM